MKILFFCPRWGTDNLSWDTFFKKIKDAGYDGVETGLPLNKKEQEPIFNGLEKHGLKLIAQHWETVHSDFEKHIGEYNNRLNSLVESKALFINSQTGKDYYSIEQNEKLLLLAKSISDEKGVPILHETHRGKFSFAAHVTKVFLEKHPWLKITLDISHWCTVAETFLNDQPESLEYAILGTEHIHARVGHTQSPQVTDPRVNEWGEALDFHLKCWDNVIDLQRKRGKEYFTITPEFGPTPYMQLKPGTNEPVSNQWKCNLYMKEILEKRYKV